MKIGGLFFGYGGLDLAAADVLGGDLAWYADVDRGALKIAGHRYPDVPNLGDVTAVDWAAVEPVDVLTGGSPCQDLSHAGQRRGMTTGTRSNLWVAMREAIAQLRPPLVVWENVRGAYSAPADSAMVQRGRLLAPRGGGPALRALGRVLGDLSDLGYDAVWHGLRAADIGAPHGRFRVFLVATDTRGQRGRETLQQDGSGAQAGNRTGIPDQPDRDALRFGPDRILLRTPTSQLAINGGSQHPDKRKAGGHGPTLADEVEHLLPTPTSTDAHASGGGYNGQANVTLTDATVRQTHGPAWGDYAAAIARWETVLGRPAPVPTVTSAKGNPQLSPVFVEWMMGLPAGWVTDVPGITRNEALKALGNGVVPQQARAAIRYALTRLEGAA